MRMDNTRREVDMRISVWRFVLFPSLLLIFFLAAFAMLPKEARAYDICDNKLELEHGEPAGPFFGLEYALIAHALAEKFCGAPATPMAPKFLAYAEKQGCGPDTPIYGTLKTSIQKLEAADLERLASDGKPSVQLSAREVQEWASAAAKGFGGCKGLLEFHAREWP
jgi:hypothetical protein